MHSHIRAPRPLVGLALAASTLALAACAGAGAGGSAAPPSTLASAPASTAAASSTASSAPTAIAAFSIDKLPEASLDPSKVAMACDEATLGTSAAMSCNDIAAVTARVAPLMSNQPIQQLAVKPSAATPGTLDVTFWVLPDEGSSGLVAFTFSIDPAAKTFTFPSQDTEAVFPTPS
jgi:hypothetical protein